MIPSQIAPTSSTIGPVDAEVEPPSFAVAEVDGTAWAAVGSELLRKRRIGDALRDAGSQAKGAARTVLHYRP